MEVKVKAIHFDVTEKLVAFINKKAEKLARHFDEITEMEVTLKVVKPETERPEFQTFITILVKNQFF